MQLDTYYFVQPRSSPADRTVVQSVALNIALPNQRGISVAMAHAKLVIYVQQRNKRVPGRRTCTAVLLSVALVVLELLKSRKASSLVTGGVTVPKVHQ